MVIMGGIRVKDILSVISNASRRLYIGKVPSWVKTRAGIASLATFIIAPAGALALSSQTFDNEANSAQTGVSNTTVSSQATNPGASSSTSNVVSQATNDGATQTSITVDDQTIDIPQNGSVHKVFETEGGTTTVDITTQNTTSGDSKVRSRSKLHFSTKSSSEIESSSTYHESSD